MKKIDENITMLMLIATVLNDKCLSSNIYNNYPCIYKHYFAA